jgi:hypothetical protein
MRQKLNENPVAQIAVIGVLAIIVGYFLLTSFGGGEEAESPGEATTPTEVAIGTPEGAVAEGAAPAAATASVQAPSERQLPQDVEAAYSEGKTIVLLIYRPGGIDDHLTSEATEVLEGIPNTALFEVKTDEIARYSAITGPLGVNQAPALIVLRDKGQNHGGAASGTVTYGFQTGLDIRQAIVDSRYKGPELSYAPN